jgi:glucose 1-dehydrogenase
MIDMTGKAALITGSSRGIGRGCALEMARAGADICVNYHRHGDEAEQVADEVRAMGRRTIVVQADVSDRAAVDAMVATTVDKLGHLDVVVANAYYNRREPFLEIDHEELRRTWDVTLWGVFHTAQSAARQMVSQGTGGSMVFISSLFAFIPYPTSMAYNAAKAAVDHMAATIAGELTAHRIRVNCIQPGWTDTPGERQYTTEQQMADGAKSLPWGRLATIEEMGRAAAFLASDASDYITGATLRIDGGYSLQPVNYSTGQPLE